MELQLADGLRCRLCDAELRRTFIDLGMAPPCESLVSPADAESGEMFYPLHARICDACLLVQLPEVLAAEQIFTDTYAYYSSFSTSWVEHARLYCESIIERIHLDSSTFVVEVASNDGYLLQHFIPKGIRVLGVEPTANTALVARGRGIPTEEVFLGARTAGELTRRFGRADLVVANNVFAHVPDLRDFTQGLAVLLAPHGTLTLEFPYLRRLIDESQYDTIYHEHYSYFTLLTAQRALATADLSIVDVEELASHGGSLRLYVQHSSSGAQASPAVHQLLRTESERGLHSVEGHDGLSGAVSRVKEELLTFLMRARAQGKLVVGYGAPGKGNTLLNHCGIRGDLLPFVVDRNHHKHGMLLPGSRIPVRPPEELTAARPDYVLVLPWNLRREIMAQLKGIAGWDAEFVFAIPRLEIVKP